MAKLVCSGKDLGYTILPYSRQFDESIEQQLLTYPNDHVLGYITNNLETGERNFTYTESGRFVPDNEHWSLSIMKEFPYCEENGPWIVYTCSPEKTQLEFGKILYNSSETLHIYDWDTWSIVEKNAKVAVITSWEIF